VAERTETGALAEVLKARYIKWRRMDDADIPSVLIDELASDALAYARAQVPDEEELARLASGCDPDMWPKTVNHNDAWTESFRRRARAIRAEMLARLGGEEG